MSTMPRAAVFRQRYMSADARADAFDALRQAFGMMWRPKRWWGWVLVVPFYAGLSFIVLGYDLRDSRSPIQRRPVSAPFPGPRIAPWLLAVVAALPWVAVQWSID